MIDDALASRAIGDTVRVDNYSAGASSSRSAIPTSTGTALIAGYGGGIASTMPIAQNGYCYAQVIPSELSFVGSNSNPSLSGGIENVTYPEDTKYGDYAILLVSWGVESSGNVITPTGWSIIEGNGLSAPYSKVFARSVVDTTPFNIIATGDKNGGGYIMHTYRRGAYDDSSSNLQGNQTELDFDPISLSASGNHVTLFGTTTLVASILTDAHLSAPYVALENQTGDNGIGLASVWSAEGEVASSGTYDPPNITPTYIDIAGSLVSFVYAVGVREVGNSWDATAENIAPIPTVDWVAQLTRHTSGASIMPMPTHSGVGVVNISGREVCIESGSANSVSIAGSLNGVVVTPSENSTVSVPIDANEVC